MKPTGLLYALLLSVVAVATYAAITLASGTNAEPAGTVWLRPPPDTTIIHFAGGIVRTATCSEIRTQLATPCPNDLEAAISCFFTNDLYATLILPKTVGNDTDKSNLIAIAGFLGEARSRRVPDYKKLQVPMNSSFQSVQISGTNFFNPGASTDPEARKAYEKALAETGLRNETFTLQQQLDMLDVNLTPRLLEACSRLSTNDPANVELIKQVSDAAHLTEAERKKLGFVGQ